MKLPVAFIIFILSSSVCEDSKIANGCENQILDKTSKLSTYEVNRMKSEIHTWESIFSSVISSCWIATIRNGECKTRFVIYARHSTDLSNYTRNSVWLSGHCTDTGILVYSIGKQECDIFQLDSNKSNFSDSAVKSESQIVVNFMSHMLQLFFNSVVRNDSVNENWNSFVGPCVIVDGKLAVSKNETTKGISLNNSSQHDLTKHHGKGGITDAVLTIICAICGSTALSFLLFFRRIRHCICSICGLCRDYDRLVSEY